MLSAYTPQDFLPPYEIYDTFDWCQIRQAFAEELYDAYYSSDGKLGVKSWYDCLIEGNAVKNALASNYSNQPMFIGAKVGEVDWISLWCLAYWYARQAAALRQEIRQDLATRTGPLIVSYEENGPAGAYCYGREFYSEPKHMQPADCFAVPRGTGNKILAFVGGLSAGLVVLGGIIYLDKSKKKK